MILDADRFGHPLTFRPENFRRIELDDRVSVLSADKYGHVNLANAREGIDLASWRFSFHLGRDFVSQASSDQCEASASYL
jgi:hypothetical protein